MSKKIMTHIRHTFKKPFCRKSIPAAGNSEGIYKGLKSMILLLYNIIPDAEKQYFSPWILRFGFLR